MWTVSRIESHGFEDDHHIHRHENVVSIIVEEVLEVTPETGSEPSLSWCQVVWGTDHIKKDESYGRFLTVFLGNQLLGTSGFRNESTLQYLKVGHPRITMRL